MYKKIKNVNWYYSLKDHGNSKGLFSVYPRNTVKNKLLVCWDFFDSSDNKSRRYYSLFKNYIDFALYHFKLKENIRCFYEIILGEKPQKPHFDLDIDMNELGEKDIQTIFNDLIISIIDVLDKKNIKINLEKDVCVYTSHGKDKYSFHVVINNYCHADNDEAKGFYLEVCKNLPHEYVNRKWVDSSVYSITQQFRCLGSHKLNSDRTKIFQETWMYKNKVIHHKYVEEADSKKQLFLIQLNESLVGARTSECELLPSYRNFSDEIVSYTASEDINMEEAKEAMNLLAASAGIKWRSSKNPFAFDKIEGPFVILKRLKSSRCKICKRIHEHQNPYLWISTDKSVYYHCRRAAADKKLFIGNLVIEPEENGIIEEVEVKPVCNNFILNNIERAKNIAKTINGNTKKVVKAIIDVDSKVELHDDINDNAKNNLKLF